MPAPTAASTRQAAIALLDAVHRDDTDALCEILTRHSSGTDDPMELLAITAGLVRVLAGLVGLALRDHHADAVEWIEQLPMRVMTTFGS